MASTNALHAKLADMMAALGVVDMDEHAAAICAALQAHDANAKAANGAFTALGRCATREIESSYVFTGMTVTQAALQFHQDLLAAKELCRHLLCDVEPAHIAEMHTAKDNPINEMAARLGHVKRLLGRGEDGWRFADWPADFWRAIEQPLECVCEAMVSLESLPGYA
jgi:hypothetical protein